MFARRSNFLSWSAQNALQQWPNWYRRARRPRPVPGGLTQKQPRPQSRPGLWTASTPAALSLITLWLVGHAFLGVAMKAAPMLATLHALMTLFFALLCAIGKDAEGVLAAVCYLATSEVLWRMTGASVFWEYGKYSVSLVLLIALARFSSRRINISGIMYFALLLPSVLLTCAAGLGIRSLRVALSSSLSGPFSLAVCSLFFYQIRLDPARLKRLLLVPLGPLAGAAAVCISGLARLESGYEFGTESNFDASGGFGPNQVSAALGIGMLTAFLWLRQSPRLSARWWIGIALILWFAGQAALTFSRTGIWLGLITMSMASILSAPRPGKLIPSILGALFVFAAFYLLVFRSLDGFTDGKLSQRYSEGGFSRREDIAKGDIRLAMRHPVLGVGPGMCKSRRNIELGIPGAPHTEFTRVLAEHGAFGLLALGTLLWMTMKTVLAARTAFQRAWTASWLAYSALFMLASGMRLVLPSVAVGLAMICFASDQTANASRSPR